MLQNNKNKKGKIGYTFIKISEKPYKRRPKSCILYKIHKNRRNIYISILHKIY